MLGIWVASVAAVASSHASSIAREPSPSGIYESFSPVRMAPVGAISAERARSLLPRWLRVTTSRRVSEVVFEPEGHLKWILVYGPFGLTTKVAMVDGQKVSTSRFSYDARGRLIAKQVIEPASGGQLSDFRKEWIFEYVVTDDGRERTDSDATERWQLLREGDGFVARTFASDKLLRMDRFDAAGRRIEIQWMAADKNPWPILRFPRGGAGELLAVERYLDGIWEPARFDAPRPGLPQGAVAKVSSAFERDEVLLVLGAPVTRSVGGEGRARRATDDYGCFVNQASAIDYDKTDKVRGIAVRCICGFCVDAAASIRGEEIEGRDEHFTAGPWVRLDGELELTADHRVLTPRGAIRAGDLRAGDEVLRAGGGVRRLRVVERLGGGTLRRGVNLRTRSGRFSAAGFVLESELPRPCP